MTNKEDKVHEQDLGLICKELLLQHRDAAREAFSYSGFKDDRERAFLRADAIRRMIDALCKKFLTAERYERFRQKMLTQIDDNHEIAVTRPNWTGYDDEVK